MREGEKPLDQEIIISPAEFQEFQSLKEEFTFHSLQDIHQTIQRFTSLKEFFFRPIGSHYQNLRASDIPQYGVKKLKRTCIRPLDILHNYKKRLFCSQLKQMLTHAVKHLSPGKIGILNLFIN